MWTPATDVWSEVLRPVLRLLSTWPDGLISSILNLNRFLRGDDKAKNLDGNVFDDELQENETIDLDAIANETQLLFFETTSSTPVHIGVDDLYRTVCRYREELPKTKRLYDPLWYFIVDHSQQHSPTYTTLKDEWNGLQQCLQGLVDFEVRTTPDNIAKILDALQNGAGIKQVIPVDPAEEDMIALWKRILKYKKARRRKLSETTHIYRNVLPHFEAIFEKNEDFQVDWGEKSSKSSAERRNQEKDPQSRARIGQKCDLLVTSTKLSFQPELLVGEVSGGVEPTCSKSKEWQDKMKLMWALRDVLVRCEKEVEEVTDGQLVVWAVHIIGWKLKVYAILRSVGLFHLVLLHECWLPSTTYDMYNTEVVLNVLETLFEKVKATELNILDLDHRKVQMSRKRKRVGAESNVIVAKKPIVISTPKRK